MTTGSTSKVDITILSYLICFIVIIAPTGILICVRYHGECLKYIIKPVKHWRDTFQYHYHPKPTRNELIWRQNTNVIKWENVSSE